MKFAFKILWRIIFILGEDECSKSVFQNPKILNCETSLQMTQAKQDFYKILTKLRENKQKFRYVKFKKYNEIILEMN